MENLEVVSSRVSGVLLLTLLLCSTSFAQRLQNRCKDPHIGYICPAGAQRGTTTTITVGGQYLENADRIYVSGEGVRAKAVGYDRPLHIGEVVRMRNRLQKLAEEKGLKELRGRDLRNALKEAEAIGITAEDIRKMGEHGRMRRKEEIQEHAQVAEMVSVEIEVLPDAKIGRRELRIFRDGRISSPLAFYIGDYPEHTEADGGQIEHPLPVVVNGQIMPAEKDRYSFRASKGDQLVMACNARELIPHLADAVPGWFQAVMTLYDADGRELAYADDYRSNPDPVLYCKIPADGIYTLEIRDALSRGRQDFVYRITLGEIPFITSLFPLGGKTGERTAVALQGKNLPVKKGTVGSQDTLRSIKGTPLACPIPFAHGCLPELLEAEPNNPVGQAMSVQQGCVINGRIGTSDDRDVFAVQLGAGGEIVAEVIARRLGSPLDSVLKITDSTGKQLAINNDCEDKSLGRMIHHADSRIVFTAPQSGLYYIHLGDLQNGGGGDYAYRLKLGRPVPDYELRVVPSNLNGVPGGSVPFTVYALRKDDFNGAIDLALENQTDGLRLDGARLPAGQDQIELTLTLPVKPLDTPESLDLRGCAVINGKPVIRPAVPAEDMMQAFIYHHLVLTDEVLVSNITTSSPRRQSSPKCDLLQLEPGKSATLTFDSPTHVDRRQLSLKVEPRNLPDGVKMAEASVGNDTIAITLITDPAATKGLEGNLLFALFIERTKPPGNQRRQGKRGATFLPAGTLPAVPFRIPK